MKNKNIKVTGLNKVHIINDDMHAKKDLAVKKQPNLKPKGKRAK